MIPRIKSIKKSLGSLDFENIAVLVFSAYLIAGIYNTAVFGGEILDVEINRYINIGAFALKISAVSAVLLAARIFIPYANLHRLILACSSVAFAVSLVALNSLEMGFNIIICAVLFFIMRYCFREPDGISFRLVNAKIKFAHVLIFISLAALAYIIIISWASVMRFNIFAAASFDFGIFAQMFESMARYGTQITTVERNMELSHFAIHISPIFYMLLPFYMIFRTPESLLVMQAVLIASGVYPLALIARKFNLSNTNIIFITIAYLFYPTLTGGAFFDFHENKFLTVIVLWMLYFIVAEKIVPMYIFAALTLGVKEDAFLYVICPAVYVMAVNFKRNTKMFVHGAVLAVLAAAYFAFAMWFLQTFGHGIMTFRYFLFMMWHEDSLFAVVRNVLVNPALILDSVLSVPEKLDFALYLFIPLCFMPFVSKNIKFALMLIAMIIINLATDYTYQYNINFQYAYGVAALLFFLTLKHLSQINPRHVTKICIMMACFSCILFTSTQYHRIRDFRLIYTHPVFSAEHRETREILSRIPDDATVTGTMFITPHLSHLRQLFAVDLHSADFFDYNTEFIIIDTRMIRDFDAYRRKLEELRLRGYRLVDAGGIIEVFQHVDFLDFD